MRRQIFIRNLEYIELNQGEGDEELGINMMSDWTEDEIQMVMQQSYQGQILDGVSIDDDMHEKAYQQTQKFDPIQDFHKSEG